MDDGFGMIDANPTISKKKLMLTQGYETKNDGIFYNGNMSITFNRDFKCFLNLLYLGYWFNYSKLFVFKIFSLIYKGTIKIAG